MNGGSHFTDGEMGSSRCDDLCDVHSSEWLSQAWDPVLPAVDPVALSLGSLGSVVATEKSEGLAPFIVYCSPSAV